MTRAARLAALATLVLTACGSPSADPTASSSEALITATGVDYSWARPSPSGLKAGGYTFACRYLSYDTTGKNLSASEAKVLWAAGVDVVANWENSGTAALSGYSQGASDAKAADSQANADGIPAGRPIYFSVDFDAQSGDMAAIEGYFDGVASVIGLDRTGAYGGLATIQDLFNKGKVKWGWQTYAWSYGSWDSRAQLRQVQNGITAAGDANCCDEDQAVAADYGQWHANAPPRGYLDSADCTGIAGCSQDPDAPATAINVDVYFNAPAGGSGAEGMRVLADVHRADLCTAIGSCDHGYSFPVPLGVQDAKAHTVYAYGIDAQGGPNTLLTNSPKTLTCPNLKPPAGVKRHVINPASMTAWSFSMLTDVAPEPDAVVSAIPSSADWQAKPDLVQANDGTPEVWLIDGEVRRHVVSPASMTAWHWTGTNVVKTPAGQVYAYPQGLDLPATPFLVSDTTAIYVIDTDPTLPPPPPAPDGGTDAGTEPPPNGDNGTTGGGGCNVGGARLDAGWGLLILGLALRRKRR